MRILMDIRDALQELPAPGTDQQALLGMKRKIVAAFRRRCVLPSTLVLQGTLLGALAPGKLTAEAWNGRIRKDFHHVARILVRAKGDVIDLAADFVMDTLKACMVFTAAMIVDNCFGSNADYVVFHADGYELKSLVSESLLDDIKAHPERYAIVSIH